MKTTLKIILILIFLAPVLFSCMGGDDDDDDDDGGDRTAWLGCLDLCKEECGECKQSCEDSGIADCDEDCYIGRDYCMLACDNEYNISP